MNARERFRRILEFGAVDGLPVLALEPYESVGLDRWRTEGLSQGMSPEEQLGMDCVCKLPVSLGPIPHNEPHIISETDEEYVETDVFGGTVRRHKEAPSMYYGYIDHPIKTPHDWEDYKSRYDSKSPGRSPLDPDAMAAEYSASDMPVGLELFPFFFRMGFYLMGMERFMTAFYDTPGLMHDMFSLYGNFVLETIRPLLGKVRIDYVAFAEDLAYKAGPHISPSVYREFWLPYQDPIVEELRGAGVKTICMYTAGNIRPLIPMLIDHGFNCTWPLERGSGMAPADLRREFGRDLALGGGFAKEALIAGPQAIDQQIEELLPVIRSGGFVPAADDMVPPEVPFEHYIYYVEAMRAIKL